MSKVASVFTYSRWDHVAMVVINDGELMILEVYLTFHYVIEHFFSSWTKTNWKQALMNSGVALHPLTRVATVINAGGTVAIRRLEVNRDSTFRQNLKNFLGFPFFCFNEICSPFCFGSTSPSFLYFGIELSSESLTSRNWACFYVRVWVKRRHRLKRALGCFVLN